ncbi:alpha/beta fold hydrolase [Amycolatopsis sp. NPDC058278]|uniref:alpha/beta fold hydrolase n=1 Tax=Amycolatopsis sp. NPDC058278 TaxID=3346417 RepID=UPI0036DB908C
MDVDLGRPPYGTQDRKVMIDGAQLAYLEAGSGSAIVLLHGNGGSSRDWNGVIPALATRNRVLAPDMPGYGESDRAGEPTPQEFARRVWSFLKAVDAGTAVVVGHSMGGLVAMNIALAHPDQVSKLVLVDSAGLGRSIGLRQIALAATPLGDVVLAASMLPGGALFQTLDTGLSSTSQPWRVPPSWWKSQLRAGRGRRALKTTHATAKLCLGPLGQKCLVDERLGELGMPTLVMWGLLDRVIPFWHGLRASRRVPQGRLHLFPWCGHAPHVEASEEFLQAIEGFLSDSDDAVKTGR